MSQDWSAISGVPYNTAMTTGVAGRLESLRTAFSGSSAPSNPVAFQLWLDTTNAVLKRRNSSNTAWTVVAAMSVPSSLGVRADVGAISATGEMQLWVPETAFIVTGVTVLGETTTSGSDGSNHWQWNLRNRTTSVDLFATKPTTNGDELTAHVGKLLTPDQNTTLSANNNLVFEYTKVGSPTSPVNAVKLYLRGYAAQ